jgi:hypothetical protein
MVFPDVGGVTIGGTVGVTNSFFLLHAITNSIIDAIRRYLIMSQLDYFISSNIIIK